MEFRYACSSIYLTVVIDMFIRFWNVNGVVSLLTQSLSIGSVLLFESLYIPYIYVYYVNRDFRARHLFCWYYLQGNMVPTMQEDYWKSVLNLIKCILLFCLFCSHDVKKFSVGRRKKILVSYNLLITILLFLLLLLVLPLLSTEYAQWARSLFSKLLRIMGDYLICSSLSG